MNRNAAQSPVKVVVLDGYTVDPGDNPWPVLKDGPEMTTFARTSPDEIYDRAKDAGILVTNKTVLDGALLRRLPHLKGITVMATGYNVVDVETARELHIPVCNVPAYGTDTVAQFVMALILELCHQVGRHAESVARGEWSTSPDWSYWKSPQVELKGLSLGIVGFGRIGRRVAGIATAFGMEILYSSRSAYSGDDLRATRVPLETLFEKSDIVSLHCALGPDNAGFVNQALLRRMKPSAFLINTARGQLINEANLAQALHDRVLAGAALDVLSAEPPSPENPLLHAPGCLITPHMAWASRAARQRIVQVTMENILAIANGSPIHVVNPLSPR